MKKLFCDKCGKETRQLYKFDVTIPDFIGTKPVAYPMNSSLDKYLCYTCMTNSLDKLINSFNPNSVETTTQKAMDKLVKDTSVEKFDKNTKTAGTPRPYTKSLNSYTDYVENKQKDSCDCGDNCKCKKEKNEVAPTKEVTETNPNVEVKVKKIDKEEATKVINEILAEMEKQLGKGLFF